MKKRTLPLATSIFFCILLFAGPTAWAGGDPPVLKVLRGAQIHADSSVLVEDSKFFDPSYNSILIKPYTVKNKITFRINEDANVYFPSAFTANVVLRIISTHADNTIDSLDWSFDVQYNPGSTYYATASLPFEGAYRVRVKVLSVTTNVGWNVWDALSVENELTSIPAYQFSCTTDTIHTISYSSLPPDTGADELPVSWPNKITADEYDLEWTYVDSSALSAGVYGDPAHPDPLLLFDNNASRVTITGTSYKIPLIYDNKGTLFFRVRVAQLKADGTRFEAHWSSDAATGLGRFAYNGHQRNLNWQATTSFAEEGKRKTVVQYYDGSLRARQTVTKDNTTNTTIVAESYNDYQGRPVIQVLPAPTLSTVIKYSQNFNTGLNGSAYDKSNFDSLADPSLYCNSGAAAMSTDSGAARYYSPGNPLKDSSFHRFIPDAGGYPFAETEYTQDNTGRISRQGGVGSMHQLGLGHETKFYYGTPDQHELDALFGTEVGDHSHYYKTMVRDANGQYSVSYTDMHGRTIATALAGTPPDSVQLDKLPSYDSASVTETLSDPNTAVIKDLTMESEKGLLVEKAGMHTFTYKLDTAALRKPGCDNTTVCYDCLYNLEITITDDCNNQKLGGQAFDTTLHNFSLSAIDTSCAPAGFNFVFTKFLPEGSYAITKRLSVSRYGMDYYRDSVFVKKNTCKTAATFINEQRSIEAAIELCKPTCQRCTDSLGTLSQFTTRFKLKAGVATGDTSYNGLINNAYAEALANCNELCNQTSEYDDIRGAMLLDMTPPSGQYANPNLKTDPYSVFYALDPLPTNSDTIPDFIKPTNYVDEYGRPDRVYDEETGATVAPQHLSMEAFVRKFKLSWAEALLPYHPEYCKLQKYQALQASASWDKRFNATDTYADAMKKGYLNPTHNAGAPYSKYNATEPADIDSIIYVSGHDYKSELETDILRYRGNTINTSGVSMWSIANLSVLCKDSTTTSCLTTYTNETNVFNPSTQCPGDLDMAWRAFRQMYQDIKREKINAQLKVSPCTATPTAQVLLTAGHQPHFSDDKELLDSNGLSIPADTAHANALQREKQAEVATYYSANCRAYVAQWFQQLGPCNYTTADTAVIMPLLIKVCTEGSDIEHPYGASSVRSSSTSSYKSFEAVINAYNASHGISNVTACNAYLITAPKSYDRKVVYSTKPIWTKPDSCECAQISRLHNSYLQLSGSYSSFSQYLQQVYQTTMTDSVASLLLSLCSGPHSSTCNYLAAPISLPGAMQCNTGDVCADCNVIGLLYNSYKIKYPNVLPAYADDNTDSAQLARNTLFENYMNNHLGFTKYTAEYLAFLDICNIASAHCDSLQAIKNDFVQYNGRIPHLDASGADTAYNLLDFGGNHYNVGVPFGQAFQNGYVHLPDAYTATLSTAVHNHVDFDHGRDTLCVDTAGFTLEARLKMPHSALIPNGFGAYWWINIDPNRSTGGILVGIDTNATAIVASPGMDSGYVAGLYTVDFNDWKVIKIKIRGRNVACYINDSLIAQRGLLAPIDSLIHWNITQWSFGGYYDYIRIYDTSGRMYYDEEFNDALHQAYPTSLTNCTDCHDRFTAYYNKRQGTSYTIAQVDSIYIAGCGAAPNPCDSTVDTLPLSGPTICGRADPVFPPVSLGQGDNCFDSSFFVVSKGTELYKVYHDSLTNNFDSSYRAKCMQAYKLESFTVTRTVSQYHYTLYYYDQAGNLVKTIAPQGVHANYDSLWLDSVKTARLAGTAKLPAHAMPTQYRYNTLNQVVGQQTPDAGISSFWYDRLGRLAISQNARQKAATVDSAFYSYTQYDYLGRIAEVGQVTDTLSNAAMTDSISRNESLLGNWLLALTNKKEQVTRTYYDLAYPEVGTIPLSAVHLRNRVAYTTFTNGSSTTAFNQATFYSYDIHGNVDTLLQDYGSSLYGSTENIMNANSCRWKRVVYDYDLISGKVNAVAYNAPYWDITTATMTNPADAFYHRYSYDAENRLTLVETSPDNVIWEKDARYEYYLHGPLARVVLGEQQVQGLDYAYTIQGWLKGLNSTTLRSAYDMGEDGKSGGQHQYIAKDAVGFNLNYFNNDYTPVKHSLTPFAGATLLGSAGRPLYNGNISSMAVNIGQFNQPYLYNYHYDQLNRLTGQDAYTGLDTTTNSWSGLTHNNTFKERVSYDANGNIQRYDRHWSFDSPIMDSLTYHYTTGTNKLSYVSEASTSYSSVNNDNDIEDEPVGNYNYDAIGNLIKDSSEHIPTGGIKWNVYGKITEISRTATTSKSNASRIQYTYDVSGNRIGKKTTYFGSARVDYTWYVRDAQGNVLHTYTATKDTSGGTTLDQFDVLLWESYIFGSSRVGHSFRNSYAEANFAGFTKYSSRGNKLFELSNHLGNVLTGISDKKLGVRDATDTAKVSYYTPDIVEAHDYFPFGMISRSYYGGAVAYRYGFNGKENDRDVKGEGDQVDYGNRIYDPRVGRFYSIDPITRKYPELTPYQFASNRPIDGIDLDGMEYLSSNAIITISLKYDAKLNKVTAASLNFNMDNVSAATRGYINYGPPENQCIGCSQVMGTKLAEIPIKPNRDATMEDAPVPKSLSAEGSDVSHPTVPSNKKEERKMIDEGSYNTSIISTTTGVAKGDALLAVLEGVKQLSLWKINSTVDADLKEALSQAPYALAAISDIQLALNEKLIVPAYQNSEDLQAFGNYLLYGQTPTRDFVAPGKAASPQVDFYKLNEFKKLKYKIDKIKSGQGAKPPRTNVNNPDLEYPASH